MSSSTGASSSATSKGALTDREVIKKFESYKPDVNLVYVDKYGRSLTPKEAFKELSHYFHGKHSGKNKIERKLRKLEGDLVLAKASSTDTPLGTVQAMQERQRATGSAFLVLSSGNKAYVAKRPNSCAPSPLACAHSHACPLTRTSTWHPRAFRDATTLGQRRDRAAADHGILGTDADARKCVVPGGTRRGGQPRRGLGHPGAARAGTAVARACCTRGRRLPGWPPSPGRGAAPGVGKGAWMGG